MDALTGWDWFVLLVGGASVAIGLFRGLVRTVFALAAWIVALLGTPLASAALMPWFGESVPMWVLHVLAFVGLFVLVRLAGGLLERGLRQIGFGGADRVLGGALGALRAAAIVTVAALVAHLAGFSTSPSWQQALSRPLLEAAVQWAEPLLPQRVSGIRRT